MASMSPDLRANYDQHVRALVAMGHRGSTTGHELQAAEYLASQLRTLGLEPIIEPFPAKRHMAWRMLLHVAVAAVGMALLWRVPAVTAILGFLALVSLIIEQSMRGFILSRLLPGGGGSQNVWATITPAPGQSSPRARLVISGHYDTQRTGLLWNDAAWRTLTPILSRLPAALQSPTLSIVAAMIAQCVVAGVALAGKHWAVGAAPGAAILLVYTVVGGLLANWAAGDYVPGASDNASGAAAVLALGEAFLAAPAEGVEVVLLFTGCEEIGLLGAMTWIDRRRALATEPPTVFLNLDGLGFGPPRVLDVEAPLAGWPVRYPADLIALAAACAEGQTDLKPRTTPGFTDGLAFLTRGLRGMTIIGSQPNGHLPHWHLPTDDAAHMDFDSAWRGVSFAWRVANRLATSALTPPAAGGSR